MKMKFRSLKEKMSRVEVVTRHPSRRISHGIVKRAVGMCARRLLPFPSCVSVAFLGDGEMTEINEAYTGRKGSTDVLSFPLGRDAGDKCWHGEVLISLDKARCQAGDKEVSLSEEVVRLIIHALVHLGGLDHYSKDGFRKMRREEFLLLLECL